MWYNEAMNLTIATYNLHMEAVKNTPNKVLDDLEYLTDRCQIVLLEEAGFADAILRQAKRHFDVETFAGTGNATDHTQVMFADTMDFRRGRSYPLSSPLYVGDDGGVPKGTLEGKDLNVAVFRYNGRRINVGPYHGVPSIYIPRRARLAREQVSAASAVARRLPGITFIGGDFNMEPDNNILDPMRKAGMHSMQTRYGFKATHGNRAIDDLWWKADPDKVRPRGTRIYEGVSDHNALISTFDIIRPR